MMPAWQPLALVMLGGAMGAAGRYWLGGALLRQFGSGIPYGTLAANLIGSFAVAFLGIDSGSFASTDKATVALLLGYR